MKTPKYQSGFANQFATEAVEGALPQPAAGGDGLYAELVSGSAFTAPRAANRRSWLYRRRPSVMAGPYQPYGHPWLKTGAKDGMPSAIWTTRRCTFAPTSRCRLRTVAERIRLGLHLLMDIFEQLAKPILR